MGFQVETDKIVTLLNRVATKSFLSEPVIKKMWYSDERTAVQEVKFESEDLKAIRRYMAYYHPVLSSIDYEQGMSFHKSRSASLMQMLTHMLSDKNIPPSYVSENANRLKQALKSHASEFANQDFATSMRDSI